MILFNLIIFIRIPDEATFLRDFLIKEVNGISSVSHFNCIHLKCHQAAARAELNLKKPKKEWEGAIIRNSHTKCNNWLPIKGKIGGEMEAGVNKYFEACSKGEVQIILILLLLFFFLFFRVTKVGLL